MLTSILPILLASAGIIEARSMLYERHDFIHRRANEATNTILSANAIQSGSFNDGSDEIGAAEVGQAKSLTSQNNFINNCAGKTLTNGLQVTTGSCNGISMGDIPAKTKMVSSIITFPQSGSNNNIQSDTTFNISVQMSNLVAGSFTNADATYYAAPQFLQNGVIVGHTHVTVQDMGKSLNPTTALDPTQFAFFKGINDAGNGQGLLQATVTGGLPAGNYRVCTMAASSNHQPVLMPVAQRGTPDDCTKFTVDGTGTTINDASNNGPKGQAAAALAASAVAAGPDVSISSVASSGASGATSASSGSAAQATGKGGKGGKGGKAVSAASSAAGVESTSIASSDSTAQATGKNGGKGGKGGKAVSAAGSAAGGESTSTTSSTSAAQATGNSGGKGQKGGNGGKAVSAAGPAAGGESTSTTSSTSAAQATGNSGGKGRKGGNGGKAVSIAGSAAGNVANSASTSTSTSSSCISSHTITVNPPAAT